MNFCFKVLSTRRVAQQWGVAVSLKGFFSTVASFPKQLFAQGVGTFGALGTGDLTDRDKYVRIDLPDSKLVPKQISAGFGHSGVVTECGKLFLMGIPIEFMRVIRMSSIRDVNKVFGAMVCRAFDFFGGLCLRSPEYMCDDVASVSCSGCLTVIRKNDGSIYCYGYNPWGQCGVDPEIGDGKVGVMHVKYLNAISVPKSQAVDTGLQHVLSLSTDGQVHSWGKGGNGQLGTGESFFCHVPKIVDIGAKCIKVSAGFSHSAALTENGDVFIWGKGCSETKFSEDEQKKYSVLRYNDKLVPRALPIPGNRKALDVATSYYSTIVVGEDYSVWAVGLGEYDRLPIVHLTAVESSASGGTLLYLRPGYQLCKGSKRVTILNPLGAGSSPLDIAIHDQEPFARESSLQFAVSDDKDTLALKILQMNSSTNHSLVLI